MKNLLYLIAAATAIWIFSWISLEKIGKSTGLAINRTESQSPGIYVYFPIKNVLQQEDLVDFSLDLSIPSLKWIRSRHYINNNQQLLKNIGAIPGDWLFTKHSTIYRCSANNFSKNCVFLGSCLQHDNNGKILFCQNWNGFKIKSNYFYLKSDRVLNSLDSRYFGLVQLKNIHHKAKIILDF